jgi:hypothetical protein
VVWLLASETIGIPALPDAVHVLLHTALFAAFTALCVPALGPLRALVLMLVFGVGVEVVQMVGTGLYARLLPEAAFDTTVDLIGGLCGLALYRNGRMALERLAGPLPLAAWVGVGLAGVALLSTISGRGAVVAGVFAILTTIVAIRSNERWDRLLGAVWFVGGLVLAALWAAG